MKRVIKQLLITALTIFAVGCSSDGDSTTTETTVKVVPGTAILSDSRLQGVAYSCGSVNGKTNGSGEFHYNNICSLVSFKIGGVQLGAIKTSDINSDGFVYPADLIGVDRNNTTDSQLVKLLQFIQSLDEDNNPYNGILITEQIQTALANATLDLRNVVTTVDEINTSVRTLGKTLIPADYAVAHYEDTLRTEQNISVNTVPPAPALFSYTPTPTNQDVMQVHITGEVGARVFINGIDTGVVIGTDHTAVVELDTAGVDGPVTSSVTLVDILGQTGDIFNATVIKDTIAPSMTVSDQQVDENVLSVTRISATDLNPVTYALRGSDADSFQINELGDISFLTAPDYETKKSYSFDVVASDGANETAQPMTVLINHLNDTIPIVTSSNINVEENKNGVFATLSSSDGDLDEVQTFTYAISGTEASNFSLDASSGELSFVTAPDYETKREYTIDVAVNDGVHNSTVKTVLIAVTPLNDIAPVLTSSNLVNIDENRFGAILQLTNSDADLNQTQTFSFSISGSDANAFRIDARTGLISFVSAPDYEVQKSYSINATVNDGVNSSAIQSIIVAINPLNDTAPIITSVPSASINENATTPVMQLSSMDGDKDQVQSLTYSIGGNDASSFRIDSTNGIVTLVSPADYESKKSYAIIVYAHDGVQSSIGQNVSITINPLNDMNPVITAPGSVAFVENSNSAVLTVTSSDPDQDQVQTFTYSLSGADDGKFSLDENTGVLTFNTIPDYEIQQVYNLTLEVNDGLFISQPQALVVNVQPLNDIAPVMITAESVSINENHTGTVIALMSSDADQDQVQTFTYTISGTDASAFSVASNGVLQFNASPDYETKKSYSILTAVNDGVHDSNTKALSVTINPLNDIAPVLSVNAEDTVNENFLGEAANLSYVDNDEDQVQTFTYRLLGEDANSFMVDNRTGVVSFSQMTDYEQKMNYNFTVEVNDGVNTSATVPVHIAVNHSNDEVPMITTLSNVSIDENQVIAFALNSIDNDLDETQTMTYGVFGVDADRFNLNPLTGALTFKNAVDFENPSDSDKNNVFELFVTVNDGLNTSNATAIQVSINNLDDVPAPPIYSGIVTGVVDDGSPVFNALVVLQDNNKHIIDGYTDAEGYYSFDLNSTFVGPFILKAYTPSGEILYSYNDGSKEVTNITPITSLIISHFAVSLSVTMDELFVNFGSIYTQRSGDFVALFESAYNTIYGYFSSYLSNMKLTGFNHIYNYFYFSGFDYDTILASLNMEVSSNVVIIRHDNNIYSTIPNINFEQIVVTGRIVDAAGNPISGAEITAHSHDNVWTVYTNADGVYSLDVPNFITLNLTVRDVIADIIIYYYQLSTFYTNSANPQQVEVIQLADYGVGSSNISGYVYNGRTSSTKIPDVDVTVRSGYNNKVGDIVTTTIADGNGDYSLTLPNGSYTLEFSKDSWTTEYYNVVVNGDSTTYNFYLNVFNTNYLAANAYMTAVLTWGDRPNDLDTHLAGPSDTSDTRFHAYYSSKVVGTTPADALDPCATEGTIASLDVDDTSAYGPETMTICKRYSSTYHYYIYNYSGSPYYDASNAKVRVSTATGTHYSFDVPYDAGNSDRYWHVFDIDEYGNIVPINVIKSSSTGLN